MYLAVSDGYSVQRCDEYKILCNDEYVHRYVTRIRMYVTLMYSAVTRMRMYVTLMYSDAFRVQRTQGRRQRRQLTVTAVTRYKHHDGNICVYVKGISYNLHDRKATRFLSIF